MAPASKPISGQAVESVWGQQVHDVAVVGRGVIATGAALGTSGQKLPIDTIVAGDPTMVDLASDELIAPVDGVYEYLATIAGTGQAAGGTYFAHLYSGPFGSATYQNVSGTAPSGGGSARRYCHAATLVLAAGTRIHVLNSNPGSGGTQQLEKISLRLIAQTLGAA